MYCSYSHNEYSLFVTFPIRFTGYIHHIVEFTGKKKLMGQGKTKLASLAMRTGSPYGSYNSSFLANFPSRNQCCVHYARKTKSSRAASTRKWIWSLRECSLRELLGRHSTLERKHRGRGNGGEETDAMIIWQKCMSLCVLTPAEWWRPSWLSLLILSSRKMCRRERTYGYIKPINALRIKLRLSAFTWSFHAPPLSVMHHFPNSRFKGMQSQSWRHQPQAPCPEQHYRLRKRVLNRNLIFIHRLSNREFKKKVCFL